MQVCVCVVEVLTVSFVCRFHGNTYTVTHTVNSLPLIAVPQPTGESHTHTLSHNKSMATSERGGDSSKYKWLQEKYYLNGYQIPTISALERRHMK